MSATWARYTALLAEAQQLSGHEAERLAAARAAYNEDGRVLERAQRSADQRVETWERRLSALQIAARATMTLPQELPLGAGAPPAADELDAALTAAEYDLDQLRRSQAYIADWRTRAAAPPPPVAPVPTVPAVPVSPVVPEAPPAPQRDRRPLVWGGIIAAIVLTSATVVAVLL